MTLKEELVEFLDHRIKDNSTKERNIEIITHHYGLRGVSRPTLNETSQQFDGIATRERIRQILNEYFRDIAKASDLPTSLKIQDILYQRSFWRTREFASILIDTELINNRAQIQGVFTLLHDLGVADTYKFYTSDLMKVSNRVKLDSIESFIIDDEIYSTFNTFYKRTKRIPGKIGIAELDYLQDPMIEMSFYKSAIQTMLTNAKSSWIYLGIIGQITQNRLEAALVARGDPGHDIA